MKFSKLILICSGLLLGSSLIADESSFNHSVYLGAEVTNRGGIYPILGVRCEASSYLVDCHGGYKFLKWNKGHEHYMSASVNVYKTLLNYSSGKLYFGPGMEIRQVEVEYEGSHYSSPYKMAPSITLGRTFNIDKTKRIFFETSYLPLHFFRRQNSNKPGYRSESLHETICRVGVSL